MSGKLPRNVINWTIHLAENFKFQTLIESFCINNNNMALIRAQRYHPEMQIPSKKYVSQVFKTILKLKDKKTKQEVLLFHIERVKSTHFFHV